MRDPLKKSVFRIVRLPQQDKAMAYPKIKFSHRRKMGPGFVVGGPRAGVVWELFVPDFQRDPQGRIARQTADEIALERVTAELRAAGISAAAANVESVDGMLLVLQQRASALRQRRARQARWQKRHGTSALRLAAMKHTSAASKARHLDIAVTEQQWDAVIAALEQGAPPGFMNRRGDTIITALVRAKNPTYVAAAAQLHVDVNQPDSRGMTPLALAAQQADLAMTKLLLKLGADPNALAILDERGVDATALMIAAAGGDNHAATLVTLATAPMARVDARNSKGWTALMFACRYRRLGAVRLLLAERANPAGVDRAGFTCSEWVRAAAAERQAKSSPRSRQPGRPSIRQVQLSPLEQAICEALEKHMHQLVSRTAITGMGAMSQQARGMTDSQASSHTQATHSKVVLSEAAIQMKQGASAFQMLEFLRSKLVAADTGGQGSTVPPQRSLRSALEDATAQYQLAATQAKAARAFIASGVEAESKRAHEHEHELAAFDVAIPPWQTWDMDPITASARPAQSAALWLGYDVDARELQRKASQSEQFLAAQGSALVRRQAEHLVAIHRARHLQGLEEAAVQEAMKRTGKSRSELQTRGVVHGRLKASKKMQAINEKVAWELGTGNFITGYEAYVSGKVHPVHGPQDVACPEGDELRLGGMPGGQEEALSSPLRPLTYSKVCGHCKSRPAHLRDVNSGDRLCEQCMLWLTKQASHRHHRFKPLPPQGLTEGIMVARTVARTQLEPPDKRKQLSTYMKVVAKSRRVDVPAQVCAAEKAHVHAVASAILESKDQAEAAKHRSSISAGPQPALAQAKAVKSERVHAESSASFASLLTPVQNATRQAARQILPDDIDPFSDEEDDPAALAAARKFRPGSRGWQLKQRGVYAANLRTYRRQRAAVSPEHTQAQKRELRAQAAAQGGTLSMLEAAVAKTHGIAQGMSVVRPDTAPDATLTALRTVIAASGSSNLPSSPAPMGPTASSRPAAARPSTAAGSSAGSLQPERLGSASLELPSTVQLGADSTAEPASAQQAKAAQEFSIVDQAKQQRLAHDASMAAKRKRAAHMARLLGAERAAEEKQAALHMLTSQASLLTAESTDPIDEEMGSYEKRRALLSSVGVHVDKLKQAAAEAEKQATALTSPNLMLQQGLGRQAKAAEAARALGDLGFGAPAAGVYAESYFAEDVARRLAADESAGARRSVLTRITQLDVARSAVGQSFRNAEVEIQRATAAKLADKARIEAKQAARRREIKQQTEHLYVRPTEVAMVLVLLEGHKHRAALSAALALRAEQEKRLTPGHYGFVATLNVLAESYRMSDEPERALDCCGESWALQQQHKYNPAAPDAVFTFDVAAKALARIGDAERCWRVVNQRWAMLRTALDECDEYKRLERAGVVPHGIGLSQYNEIIHSRQPEAAAALETLEPHYERAVRLVSSHRQFLEDPVGQARRQARNWRLLRRTISSELLFKSTAEWRVAQRWYWGEHNGDSLWEKVPDCDPLASEEDVPAQCEVESDNAGVLLREEPDLYGICANDFSDDSDDDMRAGDVQRKSTIKVRPCMAEFRVLLSVPRWRDMLCTMARRMGQNTHEIEFCAQVHAAQAAQPARVYIGGNFELQRRIEGVFADIAGAACEQHIRNPVHIPMIPMAVRGRMLDQLMISPLPRTLFNEAIALVEQFTFDHAFCEHFWPSSFGERYRLERTLTVGMPTRDMASIAKLAQQPVHMLSIRIQRIVRGWLARHRVAAVWRDKLRELWTLQRIPAGVMGSSVEEAEQFLWNKMWALGMQDWWIQAEYTVQDLEGAGIDVPEELRGSLMTESYPAGSSQMTYGWESLDSARSGLSAHGHDSEGFQWHLTPEGFQQFVDGAGVEFYRDADGWPYYVEADTNDMVYFTPAPPAPGMGLEQGSVLSDAGFSVMQEVSLAPQATPEHSGSAGHETQASSEAAGRSAKPSPHSVAQTSPHSGLSTHGRAEPPAVDQPWGTAMQQPPQSSSSSGSSAVQRTQPATRPVLPPSTPVRHGGAAESASSSESTPRAKKASMAAQLRKRPWVHYKTRDAAAVAIQRCFRGHVGRNEARRRIAQVWKYTEIIGTDGRGTGKWHYLHLPSSREQRSRPCKWIHMAWRPWHRRQNVLMQHTRAPTHGGLLRNASMMTMAGGMELQYAPSMGTEAFRAQLQQQHAGSPGSDQELYLSEMSAGVWSGRADTMDSMCSLTEEAAARKDIAAALHRSKSRSRMRVPSLIMGSSSAGAAATHDLSEEPAEAAHGVDDYGFPWFYDEYGTVCYWDASREVFYRDDSGYAYKFAPDGSSYYLDAEPAQPSTSGLEDMLAELAALG